MVRYLVRMGLDQLSSRANSLTESIRGLALLAVLVVCTACSHAAKVSDPWRTDILAAGSKATSDFERSVLVDGKITRAEYDQAVALYVKCANAHGVHISAELQPPLNLTYQYAGSGEAQPMQDSIMHTCARGTTSLIEGLYDDKLMNPRKQNLDDLTAECLVRKGLAPKGYSGAQFAADDVGRGHYPFNPDDPKNSDRFLACMEAPAN